MVDEMCCDSDINGCEFIIMYLFEDKKIFIVEVFNFVLRGFYEIVVFDLVFGLCIEMVDVVFLSLNDVVFIDGFGDVSMIFKINNIGESFVVIVK